MSEVTKEVFIAKYALTQDIYTTKVKVNGTDAVDYPEKGYGMVFYHKGDWFETYEGALARAEELRTRRIASLKRSIAKLEKLKFTNPVARKEPRP